VLPPDLDPAWRAFLEQQIGGPTGRYDLGPDPFEYGRGGVWLPFGGNFGVATSFDFQLHPVDPMMLGGELVYSFADAPAVIKFLFDSAPEMPEELNVDMSLLRLRLQLQMNHSMGL